MTGGRILTQVYEIQTPAEAETMAGLGVDHIGSVLLEDGRDEILRQAIDTVRRCGAVSSLIPLFSETAAVLRALDCYRPDIVHFCEDLEQYRGVPDRWQALTDLQAAVRDRFPQVRIMRSIPIARPGRGQSVATLDWARRFEGLSDLFLTDTLLDAGGTPGGDQPVSGFVGITGETCDWEVAARLVEASRIPVILAGGISPENAHAGVMRVRPAGVDSCTRTNALDGAGRPVRFRKDAGKVARLVAAVRRAEADLAAADLAAAS